MKARQVPPWLGRRIRRERELRGWSQRAMSAACGGLSCVSICKIENGQDFTVTSAIAIAAGLGMPLAELLADPVCLACDGHAPPGFTCDGCGRGGTGWA